MHRKVLPHHPIYESAVLLSYTLPDYTFLKHTNSNNVKNLVVSVLAP